MLAIAGHYGRAAFLQAVIERYHVDPQSKDDAGKSALHRAAEQGQLEVLRYLFTKNLNFEEVALQNPHNHPTLISICITLSIFRLFVVLAVHLLSLFFGHQYHPLYV